MWEMVYTHLQVLGMYLITCHAPNLLLLQSHSEMEVFKVEQHLYPKIAVHNGRSAWECYAELCEALGDHGLTAWVHAFRSGRVSSLNMYSSRCKLAQMTLMVFAAFPIIGSKP
jgi:hypothetical protein